MISPQINVTDPTFIYKRLQLMTLLRLLKQHLAIVREQRDI